MKATFPVMPAKRLGYRRKQVNRSMMANSATFVCTTWFSQLQRSALNKNVYQKKFSCYTCLGKISSSAAGNISSRSNIYMTQKDRLTLWATGNANVAKI